MSIAFLIQALGLMPLFAARAFLPAFLMALTMAYPKLMPFVEAPEVAPDTFITHPAVVLILGVLALLEILADKNTDLKQFFILADPYVKPLLYALITTQLVDEASIGVLKTIHQAGFVGEYGGTLLLAAGVYFLTLLKTQIEEYLLSIDEDGDLYLHTIASSFQDVFVFFGFFLLLAFGLLALLFFGIAVLALFLLKKRIAAKEEKQKIACAKCQHLNTPFALSCAKCKTPTAVAFQIGFFGQKRQKQVSNPEKHQFSLQTQKRCTACGTKLEDARACRACGKAVFESAESKKKYLRKIELRLIPTVVLAVGLGFIPILGIVLAMLYANLYLNAPLKRYLPTLQSLSTAIFIKFLIFLVLFFGSMAGFILAPLYVLIRFTLWRRAFLAVR
ncbi:hypothetical protein [Hugenholtzia roseola]|uniref:hypothetical protein n=1 Tax=Hugenholtzia roseola TaxID=1002 RepID=UPI00047C6EC2|nr:hypothetical protein [Hugenholtzia roseola]